MDQIKRILLRLGFGADANITRIRRRRTTYAFISRRLPFLRLALFVVGYLWMILIPSPPLSRGTYIDENALQPGQVTTYWSWSDVHNADIYLQRLEQLRDANSTSEQIAQFIADEFNKCGIAASTQKYSFSTSTGTINGTNAYAILASPRAPGNEAIIISASWLSLVGDDALNLRGVSVVLALAAFLKGYSLWAKDIVFVISDGYLDGMHAWLSAYHGSIQSNLDAEHLRLSSGVIWTALIIDYPGHSFSHLGIFLEGLNGRLPNQDFVNSFRHISRYTGGVPAVIYDHLDPRDYPHRRNEFDIIPSWVPNVIRDLGAVKEYGYHARNVLRHVGYQARGKPSGAHGLFHQFRIDSFTVFAVPATGPHGFHAIGRIVESTLRTMNNLLERLHASFFLYILTGPEKFLKIGYYLPSAVLISVAMMFGGLRKWVDAGWVFVTPGDSHQQKGGEPADVTATAARWKRRRRPVLEALGIMISTHMMGTALFYFITRSWFLEHQLILSAVFVMAISILPLILVFAIPETSTFHIAPLSTLLNGLNLCLASTVISITTVLNFSLAAALAVILGLSLSLSSPSHKFYVGLGKYIAFVLLAFGWMLWAPEHTKNAIRDWELLGVWFSPFVCMVYVPVVLQAGVACLLPA